MGTEAGNFVDIYVGVVFVLTVTTFASKIRRASSKKKEEGVLEVEQQGENRTVVESVGEEMYKDHWTALMVHPRFVIMNTKYSKLG